MAPFVRRDLFTVMSIAFYRVQERCIPHCTLAGAANKRWACGPSRRWKLSCFSGCLTASRAASPTSQMALTQQHEKQLQPQADPRHQHSGSPRQLQVHNMLRELLGARLRTVRCRASTMTSSPGRCKAFAPVAEAPMVMRMMAATLMLPTRRRKMARRSNRLQQSGGGSLRRLSAATLPLQKETAWQARMVRRLRSAPMMCAAREARLGAHATAKGKQLLLQLKAVVRRRRQHRGQLAATRKSSG